MAEKRKPLPFMAVLQPEDYGPVLRCMIIRTAMEEDRKWVENYRFPGEIRAMFRSDGNGQKNPQGGYVTVFPVSGPEIGWTQGFVYDVKKERNTYRDLSLPGLKCTRVICPVLDRFINRKPYTKDGITIRYRDYLPESYRNRKGVRTTRKGTLPLIIWLHGLGEGGTDPSLVLLGNRVTALTDVTVQCYFPDTGAAVLAPQCPTMWMDADGHSHWNESELEKTGGVSFYTAALKGLIGKYLQAHPEIDRSRIYIGGCSNGGYMTIQMILAMPGRFAAAYPICPAYHAAWMTDARIRKLAKVPMWITSAATDQTVPLRDKDGKPAYADALYEKLNAYKKNNENAGPGGASPKTEPSPQDENDGHSLPDLVYSRLPQVMGFTSKGLPYEYFGHWSWIPVLQDQVTKEFDREEVHLFEWMAAKHL